MKVKGTAVIEVDISYDEALSVVLNHLGYSDNMLILEADDNRNTTGSRGLFRYEAPNFYLITHNVERIKNFEVAELLVSRKNVCIFGTEE